MENKKTFGLSSFSLKLIAAILMTLDHVALLFIPRGIGDIPTSYYILRALGKMSFPIYAFLATEGAYHTKNVKYYLLRLGFLAILMDGFGYAFGAVCNLSIATNPLLGNAFTDMFMGVLMITLFRRKDKYSIFGLLPIAYEVLSNVVIDANYGTLFKSDWGTFSIVLFLLYFLFREATAYRLKAKARNDGLDEEAYLMEENHSIQIAEAIALVLTEAIFYLIYRINYQAFVLPNEFVPIGTYSTLAFLFLLLYNGKKGYESKKIQYGFYLYYPFHLIVLGIISMFCGVLAAL